MYGNTYRFSFTITFNLCRAGDVIQTAFISLETLVCLCVSRISFVFEKTLVPSWINLQLANFFCVPKLLFVTFLRKSSIFPLLALLL